MIGVIDMAYKQAVFLPQVNSIGRVCYSSKNMAIRTKLKRGVIMSGILIIAAVTGIGVTSVLNENALQEFKNNNLDMSNKTLAQYNNEKPVNNFHNDITYNAGDEINIEKCDFSKITVVLDAADDSNELYDNLLNTKQQFDSMGINCLVTSYYDSAIEAIKKIKQTTNHDVYVATIQNGHNKMEEHYVMTNFNNNVDALNGSIKDGDSNSADGFALAIKTSLGDAKLKKGLQRDYTDYDRRPSKLEEQINEFNLKGVKAVTIRPSEVTSLDNKKLSNALIEGIIRTSTIDNDQTYFVRAGSNQVFTTSDGKTGSYAVPGTIKTKYPNAPQPERAFEEDSFYSDAAILTRPIPPQLTNEVKINLSNGINQAYNESHEKIVR